MKEFLRDAINRILLGASSIIIIWLFLFFYFFIKQNNIPIVLHYNVDWGVDYLGEVKSIFILPLVGGIIMAINGFLALKIWKKNRFLSYFLTAATLIVQCFLVIGGIALYMINK